MKCTNCEASHCVISWSPCLIS